MAQNFRQSKTTEEVWIERYTPISFYPLSTRHLRTEVISIVSSSLSESLDRKSSNLLDDTFINFIQTSWIAPKFTQRQITYRGQSCAHLPMCYRGQVVRLHLPHGKAVQCFTLPATSPQNSQWHFPIASQSQTPPDLDTWQKHQSQSSKSFLNPTLLFEGKVFCFCLFSK